jgi:hypothetical protein
MPAVAAAAAAAAVAACKTGSYSCLYVPSRTTPYVHNTLRRCLQESLQDKPALLPHLMNDTLPLTQLTLLGVRRVDTPPQRHQHWQQPL